MIRIIGIMNHNTLIINKKIKELITTAIVAIPPICIFNNNPLLTTLTSLLDFKLFYVLKDMLFQF